MVLAATKVTKQQILSILHLSSSEIKFVEQSKQMYHGHISSRNRMIEMYHAGTPAPVKEHIAQMMATDDGQIGTLICTAAFGMGVNWKSMRHVIHFGPSKSVELYFQESGCAGGIAFLVHVYSCT